MIMTKEQLQKEIEARVRIRANIKNLFDAPDRDIVNFNDNEDLVEAYSRLTIEIDLLKKLTQDCY